MLCLENAVKFKKPSDSLCMNISTSKLRGNEHSLIISLIEIISPPIPRERNMRTANGSLLGTNRIRVELSEAGGKKRRLEVAHLYQYLLTTNAPWPDQSRCQCCLSHLAWSSSIKPGSGNWFRQEYCLYIQGLTCLKTRHVCFSTVLSRLLDENADSRLVMEMPDQWGHKPHLHCS